MIRPYLDNTSCGVDHNTKEGRGRDYLVKYWLYHPIQMHPPKSSWHMPHSEPKPISRYSKRTGHKACWKSQTRMQAKGLMRKQSQLHTGESFPFLFGPAETTCHGQHQALGNRPAHWHRRALHIYCASARMRFQHLCLKHDSVPLRIKSKKKRKNTHTSTSLVLLFEIHSCSGKTSQMPEGGQMSAVMCARSP